MRQRNIAYANTLRNVRQRNIAKASNSIGGLLHGKRAAMVEHGVYYASAAYGELVRALGGAFADSKHRPIVCLVESKEQPGLYWAIPMGKWNHRTQEQQARIYRYLDLPENDIRSCYYHLGRTTSKSIFFVSDAFPITEKIYRIRPFGCEWRALHHQKPEAFGAAAEKTASHLVH